MSIVYTPASLKDNASYKYYYDQLSRVDTVAIWRSGRHNAMMYTYDMYNLSSDCFATHSFVPITDVVAASDVYNNVTGLKTHEQVCELGTIYSQTPTYTYRTFYYDYRNRLIQSVETTPDGHTLRISYKYDYIGNILVRDEQQTVDGNSTSIRYTYTHNNAGDVKTEKVAVNGSVIETTTNEYNDIGQLTDTHTSHDITTSYKYNIQGWVTQKESMIKYWFTPLPRNNITSTNTLSNSIENKNTAAPLLLPVEGSLPTTTRDPDFYPFELFFGSVLYYYDSNQLPSLYSGNISHSKWTYSSNAEDVVHCDHTYDLLGRLTQDTRTQGLILPQTVESLAYDKNGNVTSLNRYGKMYAFSRTGNQLSNIVENSVSSAVSYDTAGNIARIAAKDLQISNNLLNLPSRISVAEQVRKYRYLVDGTKLEMRDSTTNNGYAYLGSARYTVSNGVATFESVPFAMGRIRKDADGYAVHAYITDHVGNTRAIVDGINQTVIAKFDYTPFGVCTADTTATATTDYRLTGKELQNITDTELYDFGARYYLPEYATWTSQDPLAEQYYATSPYVYCNNNPMKFIDRDGGTIRVYDYANDQRTAYEWRQNEGNWGFYDSNNTLYTGNNTYIGQLSVALTGLMNGGTTGYDLVSGLTNDSNVLTMWQQDVSRAIGNDVGWNPTGVRNDGTSEAVPTTTGMSNDPMMALGHELGHVVFNWSGQNRTTWYNMTVADKQGNPIQQSVPTSEIYTTHIENRLRSENNLPLRTHYGVRDGYGYGPRIITPAGASRYYNSGGITTYRPLRRGVAPYRY